MRDTVEAFQSNFVQIRFGGSDFQVYQQHDGWRS